MIEEIFFIEKQSYRASPVHQLDARTKLLVTLAVILAIVAIPYSRVVFLAGGIFLLYFLVLWILSAISPVIYLRRLALILPVWGGIIAFQVFLTNRYYPVFHPILSLPLGISVYAESVEFAGILLVKFLVCVSFIILLSSTTRIHDLLEGASRLGLPAEFALTMGMMIRYLFVFGYIYRKVNEALATRCFDPLDPRLPVLYRIRELGYTIGTLFIRSYEQGERTFTAMLCRGYGRHSHIFVARKPLAMGDWAFLAVGLAVPLAAVIAFSLPW